MADEVDHVINETKFKFLFCGKESQEIAIKLVNNYSHIKVNLKKYNTIKDKI